MTYDLSGTTVVVTGGNDGIGAALARGAGLAGAAVAIWARNEARNRATVATLRAEGIDAWLWFVMWPPKPTSNGR